MMLSVSQYILCLLFVHIKFNYDIKLLLLVYLLIVCKHFVHYILKRHSIIFINILHANFFLNAKVL